HQPQPVGRTGLETPQSALRITAPADLHWLARPPGPHHIDISVTHLFPFPFTVTPGQVRLFLRVTTSCSRLHLAVAMGHSSVNRAPWASGSPSKRDYVAPLRLGLRAEPVVPDVSVPGGFPEPASLQEARNRPGQKRPVHPDLFCDLLAGHDYAVPAVRMLDGHEIEDHYPPLGVRQAQGLAQHPGFDCGNARCVHDAVRPRCSGSPGTTGSR